MLMNVASLDPNIAKALGIMSSSRLKYAPMDVARVSAKKALDIIAIDRLPTIRSETMADWRQSSEIAEAHRPNWNCEGRPASNQLHPSHYRTG